MVGTGFEHFLCYLIYVSTRREVRYYLFLYIFFSMHGNSLPEVCKLAMGNTASKVWIQDSKKAVCYA